MVHSASCTDKGEDATCYSGSADELAALLEGLTAGGHVVRGPRVFGKRLRHPAVRPADAVAFLGMDTCERREFADVKLGEPTEDGFEWVYVYPLDPVVWFAERPGEPYPLARVMILFPGWAPDPADLRGQPVMLAGGIVARGGGGRVTALLARPRLPVKPR